MAETVDRPLGQRVLALLVDPSGWIHRKVERLHFVGEARVRRQISFDFELPDWVTAGDVLTGVPLTLLGKDVLWGFDAWDETGASVPMLSRAQNGLVGWSVLVVAAELALPEGQDASTALKQKLWEVATSSPDEAARAAALLTGPQPPPALAVEVAAMRSSSRWDWFQKVIDDLAPHYIMLLCVEDLSRRRIVKIASDVDLVQRRDPLWTHLAWRPATFFFPVPGAGEAASYHFELEPPDGLAASAARLDIKVKDAKYDSGNAGTPALVHLYPRDAPPGESWDAVARVDLRPERRGLLRSSLVVAWVATLLLGLGAVFVHDLADVQGEAGAAILLAIPATFAAFISRPSEHRLASDLYRGLRVIALVVGMVLYAAAIALVVTSCPQALRLAWGIGAGVARTGSARLRPWP